MRNDTTESRMSYLRVRRPCTSRLAFGHLTMEAAAFAKMLLQFGVIRSPDYNVCDASFNGPSDVGIKPPATSVTAPSAPEANSQSYSQESESNSEENFWDSLKKNLDVLAPGGRSPSTLSEVKEFHNELLYTRLSLDDIERIVAGNPAFAH